MSLLSMYNGNRKCTPQGAEHNICCQFSRCVYTAVYIRTQMQTQKIKTH